VTPGFVHPVPPDQVEPVTHGGEARALRETVQRAADRSLNVRGDGDVLNPSATGAHEMVMMLRQTFIQLETREVVIRDDPADDSCLLEHRQVPIRGALWHRPLPEEEIADRHRPSRHHQRIHQRAPIRRVPLTDAMEPLLHGRMKLA
jgi:hypothetical protein